MLVDLVSFEALATLWKGWIPSGLPVLQENGDSLVTVSLSFLCVYGSLSW